jgi:hypothetical protein
MESLNILLKNIWSRGEFVASKPTAKEVEEVIPAEMNITMKQVEHLQILQNLKKFPMENNQKKL